MSGQIVVELVIASKGTKKFAFVWTLISQGSTHIDRAYIELHDGMSTLGPLGSTADSLKDA